MVDELSPDARSREDRVVLGLLADLRARGISAVLVEQPDRLTETQRRYASVTSDALFRIESMGPAQDWACDVMALAAPFAHELIRSTFDELLGPVASEYRLVICVEGQFTSGSGQAGAEGGTRELAEAKSIAQKVIRSVRGSASGSATVSALTATWRPAGVQLPGDAARAADPIEDDSRVEVLLMAPVPSTDLTEQIAATLREPLRKKATRQAARARAAGCQAAVLLDWVGHADISQRTHWLAQNPSTVQAAVRQVLTRVDSHLDAVLLVDRSGRWHLLCGKFPGFDLVEPMTITVVAP